MKTESIERAYAYAKERFAAIGVDTDAAIAKMNEIPLTSQYRHELKYRINPAFSNALRQRLRTCMLRDPNSKDDGRYTVTSLYFDNCFDKALKEKRHGLNRRESKCRLSFSDLSP